MSSASRDSGSGDDDSTDNANMDVEVPHGGHAVVLCIGFGVWQQIATLIGSLRTEWMLHIPLLVHVQVLSLPSLVLLSKLLGLD